MPPFPSSTKVLVDASSDPRVLISVRRAVLALVSDILGAGGDGGGNSGLAHVAVQVERAAWPGSGAGSGGGGAGSGGYGIGGSYNYAISTSMGHLPGPEPTL